MSNNTQQLQEAVMYSETMLKDAEAGDWKNVFEIEAQRRELLEKLFSNSNSKNTVEDMDENIRKIIDINLKLEALTRKARDTAHDEIASLSKGRNAINQYAQHTV